MRYRSLAACVADLEKHQHLVRIEDEIDPFLEAATLHRLVYAAKGPALLFTNLKGTRFPAVSNLFGTEERCQFIFRATLGPVKRIISCKANPRQALLRPWKYLDLPLRAFSALPRKVRGGPVFFGETTLAQLPQITAWPLDGGPFITLPQVYTEDPAHPGVMKANIGMYRVQLSGNQYAANSEVGLHYQIHRGISVHHSEAIKRGKPLRVSIFVGGPPGHTVAAVMPLPEGLPETLFAGMLTGYRMRLAMRNGHRISVDADFCFIGTIDPQRTLPEGPFGDHLGYYSLKHDFPVMTVEKIFHRQDAIWPFTVVGRPPQEDTSFGALIHDLTGPVVPTEIPGVKALNAVDAAGVHPLLLAIGSERYVPYQQRKPQELLTIANAILGFGQCSLAKYLMIAACEDNPDLDINNIAAFFNHVLQRVDWARDLHFQTETTIDTLDYSGTGLNSGSKVVIACAGDIKRKLGTTAPTGLSHRMTLIQDGILALQSRHFSTYENAAQELAETTRDLQSMDLSTFPLIVLCDDADFLQNNLHNFLWVCFTRSNPSHDIYGVDSFTRHKHWGCHGPLIIDARIKPHHAPPLLEEPAVYERMKSYLVSNTALSSLCSLQH